jgi:hypothetical protein
MTAFFKSTKNITMKETETKPNDFWEKLEHQIGGILYEGNGTGSGATSIVNFLKKEFALRPLKNITITLDTLIPKDVEITDLSKEDREKLKEKVRSLLLNATYSVLPSSSEIKYNKLEPKLIVPTDQEIEDKVAEMYAHVKHKVTDDACVFGMKVMRDWIEKLNPIILENSTNQQNQNGNTEHPKD